MIMQLKDEFIKLRKEYIAGRFSKLNEVQREAVLHTGGPVLILAGAGSGKTTVVVNRIKNLLEFGDAYESDYVAREIAEKDIELLKQSLSKSAPVSPEIQPLLKTGFIEPWNILAITFTNKAAAELKSRICESVGNSGNDVFAATFHSSCVRFLRRNADLLGFPKNFTIYDTDDSQRALKEIYKDKNIDEKLFPVRAVHGRIGRIKDEMISPTDFAEQAANYNDKIIAQIYAAYQTKLKRAGAFDFDDLIYYTVILLTQFPEIREYYNHKFKYIMVDEYQDTSYAQYRLIELLTDRSCNLCVVGDDDQSIYRFRGATIENILNFEERFKGTKVVRLEQNYRSTECILEAANQVISKNKGRKGKTLWTDSGMGDLVSVYCADDEREEAVYVSLKIAKNKGDGIPLKQQAVLYRMNAQSNAIESYFARAGIPYRVIGGLRFYDRAEIKDIMAYLNIIDNPGDDLRLTRIINRPARKIGDATVSQILQISSGLGISMLEVIRDVETYPSLSRAKNSLKEFYSMYEKLVETYHERNLHDFVDELLNITGYRKMLVDMKDEGITKLENVEEFISSIRAFESENPEGDLTLFLEEIALVANIDTYDENTDAVVLMTLHSAKGLEFDCVYIIGMEEGIFPGDQSRFNTEDLEEERRLAYVGITRARKRLYMTRTSMRMLFGQTRRNAESRFMLEFSDDLKNDDAPNKTALNSRDKSGLESRGQYEYRQSNEAANYKIDRVPKPKPKFGDTISVGGTATAARKAGKTGARFGSGDVVDHKIFGKGKVLSATPLGGDLLLEIDFEKGGKKKAMANYAPLVKL
ncbi:MAG: 3'-5' exonuclease [Oscillospiraceae bacterium]